MNPTLKKSTKSNLLKALLSDDKALFIALSYENQMNFLNSIWDLYSMPSEDDRYKNAYDDIVQHTLNNSDYDNEHLFFQRLELIENDKTFILFLNNVVLPIYRQSEDEIVKYVLFINSFINKEGHEMTLSELDENDTPIYVFGEISSTDKPIDLPPNNIPFFVTDDGKQVGYGQYHPEKPDTFPSFVLLTDEWDDFGNKTTFQLFYFDSDEKLTQIGYTRITNGENSRTSEIIDERFLNLNNEFISLSYDDEYYSKLKKIFPKRFPSILFALKDVGLFPELSDKYTHNDIFNDSLLRDDNSERNFREIKHKLFDFDLDNLYNFSYSFCPKYSKEPVEIEFDFNESNDFGNRVFGVIGKNGAGKTQLISSLPLDIAKKRDGLFSPRAPLFSKVISVSYSAFDNFDLPNNTTQFNYHYCGLLNDKNRKSKELLSDRQRILRFHISRKKIDEMGRMNQWVKILNNFLDSDFMAQLFDKKTHFQYGSTYEFNMDNFNTIKHQLSSGQNIVLFIITEIISHIRYDSLILFDELETHLHPNAITRLMNSIFDLVNEFQSYCIITTHSPIVIQELFSKNVFVMEKNYNIPSIRRVGIETYGENLSTLTELVFGEREVKKQYKKTIDELASSNTYEEILTLLETNESPLSINARLYIKSKLK